MRTFVFLLAGLLPAAVFSQQQDSLTLISEVVIDSYHKPVAFLKSTKSAAVATNILLQQNSAESLQLSLNLLPGTRMEERSPGSYRLSVRGSTLRSPFGIRNIKIYLDEKEELLEAIKPQFIILKPSLVGGFSGCDEWISLAKKYKIGWWITSALESNIGLNAIAQYTFTKNVSLPQGLGTGNLFTNNFEGSLELKKDILYYKL